MVRSRAQLRLHISVRMQVREISNGAQALSLFVSCSCCYHGYGLFTTVTLVWFGHTDHKPRAMNRSEKRILLDIDATLSLKDDRIRSEPEHTFRTFARTRSDPSGTVGNDSGIRPLIRSDSARFRAFPDGSVRPPGSITSQTGFTDHVRLVRVDCGSLFTQNIDGEVY